MVSISGSLVVFKSPCLALAGIQPGWQQYSRRHVPDERRKPRARGGRDVSLQAPHTTVRFHGTHKRELEWHAPNFGAPTHNPIAERPVPL